MSKGLRLFALVLMCIAASVVTATTGSHERHVLYNREQPPPLWRMGDRAQGDERLQVMIALRHSKEQLQRLSALYDRITDPESPVWGQFLSAEEMEELMSVPVQQRRDVEQWLMDVGGLARSDIRNVGGDSLEITTDTRTLTSLFHTKFHVFHHRPRSGSNGSSGSAPVEHVPIVRSIGEYSIPAHLSRHIEMVEGVSSFPIPRSDNDLVHHQHRTTVTTPPCANITCHHQQHQSNVDLAKDNIVVVPQTTDSFYNKPVRLGSTSAAAAAAAAAGTTPSSQGVIEFEGQAFAPTDLQSYAKNVGIDIRGLAAPHIIGNDPKPSAAGDESTLDIEAIAGTNPDAENYFWLESGWMYTFASNFAAKKGNDFPLVISASYGVYEGDQCIPGIFTCLKLGVKAPQYVARTNVEFQKVGLRGVTLVVASGDSGANGRMDGLCLAHTLMPAYPAASPFVTTVGATQVTQPVYNLASPPPICSQPGMHCPSGGVETAVSYKIAQFASGGGFSNYSSSPTYQHTAVRQYLNSGVKLPPPGYYNAANRAYPDVSAFGHNLYTFQQSFGGSSLASGTSASAPTFSAIVAALNAYKLQKTATPLGPLNALLYKMHEECSDCFHDITIGNNRCTEDGCGIDNDCVGFDCARGWDPVTGLGSPDYKAMLAYLKTLIG